MAIIGIVAVAKNFAIGKDGKLPWHYPSDLKFFKQTTTNHAVVMGFNTWQSIGKSLPNRLNVVLSRSAHIESQPNVLVLRSEAAVAALSGYLKCDTFIIGGAAVYQSFAGLIEKWIVTEIPETIAAADTFMPPDFLENFSLQSARDLDDNLKLKFTKG